MGTGSDLCVYPRSLVPRRRERVNYDICAAMALPSTPTDGCLSASTSAYTGTSRGVSLWPTSHDRHQTHFWTGQRCHRRPLSRRYRHCAPIIRRIGRIARRRRRAPNTPGVNHRPMNGKTTNPRHHGLHLLRHLCRETSTVRFSSPMAPSVPVLASPASAPKSPVTR
jgi:hypothetical protein